MGLAGGDDAAAVVRLRHSPAAATVAPLPAPDADRRLTAALRESSNRQTADALLLQRACGLRIGELLDLELDCVHEVSGLGAWLKVPLGKLDTERMVPIDDDTVDLVDRLAAARAAGCPLPHPRTGRPAEFLLLRHGQRISATGLRNELRRAAATAGLDEVTPHQLRHTFATAMVNAGCSLQALMALLGHQSARMSLRYGRLFYTTVRADYQPALELAKSHLGPVLPEQRITLSLNDITHGDWRDAPLIKARLAGGYCLRTQAQGVCPTPTSANTAPTSAVTTVSLPCSARNAPTPPPWPSTPSNADGPTKPPATASSSNGSTRS